MRFRRKKIEQKIEFIARTPYAWAVCPKPFPAKNAMPDWWKEMSPYSEFIMGDKVDSTKFVIHNRIGNGTGKKCIPMQDSMASGYVIPLWSDVLVSVDPDTKTRSINWLVTETVFEQHGDESYLVEKYDGYDQPPIKFANQWLIKTPPGYSSLIVPPFANKNPDFKIIPAIVDTDKTQIQIAPPGYFKTGFEGVLSKGTPIMQVIPFKRDNWKATYSSLPEGAYRTLLDMLSLSTVVNNYPRKIHQKKHYN